ncbi:MAG: hypothetical protein ACMXYL_03350 [Candidatus Woesearchaeota archaeon]
MSASNNDNIVLVASCLPGFADALAIESERHNMTVTSKNDSYLIIEGSVIDSYSMITCSQTAIGMMVLLGRMDYNGMFTPQNNITGIKSIMDDKFKIVSRDIAHDTIMAVSNMITKEMGLEPSLDNYNLPIGIIEDNGNHIIGINAYSHDYHKRDYRVYSSRQSSNPVLYASLLELAINNNTNSMIDFLCQDGTFCIEYALRESNTIRRHNSHMMTRLLIEDIYNNINVDYYEPSSGIYCYDESMPSIAKARHNSRLAGVERHIRFGRMNIDYIPLSHEPNSISLIASKLPLLSQSYNKKMYTGLARRLLKTANKILCDDGKIVLLSNEKDILLDIMREHGFTHYNIMEYSKGESLLYGIIGSRGGL